VTTQIDVGVTPILVSNFDWTGFLKDAADLCGHSPIHGVDSYPYKLKDYARLIAVFGEFREGKSLEPRKTIRTGGDLLAHLHYGFLINGSSSLIFQIMELTDLKIISTKMKSKGRVAIVTGTLEQWKHAIINVLSTKRHPDVTFAMGRCLDFFYQLGLQDVWHDYRRHSDNLLERK